MVPWDRFAAYQQADHSKARHTGAEQLADDSRFLQHHLGGVILQQLGAQPPAERQGGGGVGAGAESDLLYGDGYDTEVERKWEMRSIYCMHDVKTM